MVILDTDIVHRCILAGDSDFQTLPDFRQKKEETVEVTP
jgi:hypothetical protein